MGKQRELGPLIQVNQTETVVTCDGSGCVPVEFEDSGGNT